VTDGGPEVGATGPSREVSRERESPLPRLPRLRIEGNLPRSASGIEFERPFDPRERDPVGNELVESPGVGLDHRQESGAGPRS